MDSINGMTQEIWDALSRQEREALRDNSGLTGLLLGLEGYRVEAIRNDGTPARFIVGKSTGWRPCHLEIAKINSSVGSPADTDYRHIRPLYKVRG